IDGRLVEESREALRLLLHAPLQIHHLALEILDHFGDGGTLLGSEPDVLLVLHHELRWKQDSCERILRSLRRLLCTPLRRREREQDEGPNQACTKCLYSVLASRPRGPSCRPLRS